jgi:hypothetical protein
MAPLAHHAGEPALAPLLLLLGSGGIPLLVAIARAKLTRRVRGPEQRPRDGRR